MKDSTPILSQKRFKTTGDYRKVCNLMKSVEYGVDAPTDKISRDDLSLASILKSILGADSRDQAERVLSLHKILHWIISYCDIIPIRILEDARMRRFVWDVLGCQKGLPNQETLKILVDSLYHVSISQRDNLLQYNNAHQMSIHVKSHRNSSGSACQIMATSLRLQNGSRVFDWIGKEQLDRNFRVLLQRNVNGYVINSSHALQICQDLESVSPASIAFPCQSYALGELLHSIIQSDIYLQQMLQESQKVYEYAKKENLCSNDLLSEIHSLVDIVGGSKANHPSKSHLCPYMLCIDKLSRDWGTSSFSHKIAFTSDNEHFWTHVASYADLLKPLVHFIAYLETNEPSLGQIHLLWRYLIHHVDRWCETVEKEKKTTTYSMNCFSTEKIHGDFHAYRSKYYHPAFTLGYLLDCRLWSVSLGIARPNTSRVSYEEIQNATELAARVSHHPDDVREELASFVQYGVKDEGTLGALSGVIQNEWLIQDDSCLKQMQLLGKAWGVEGSKSILNQSFPQLSGCFTYLSAMKGTTIRSKSIPSVLAWLVKTINTQIPYDLAKKMAAIALATRASSDTDPTSSCWSCLGIGRDDIAKAQNAINDAIRNESKEIEDYTCCTTLPGTYFTRGYEELPRYPCKRTPEMTHPHEPLLQLTDQTKIASLEWIPRSTESPKNVFMYDEIPQEEHRYREDRDIVTKKNLMSDFDASMHPHTKKRRT